MWIIRHPFLALDCIKPKSSGFIAGAIHEMFDRVRKKHPQARATFRWISSHLEVGGNEERQIDMRS